MFLHLIIDESKEECSRMMEAPLIKAGALLTPASRYKNLGYKHPLGEDFYALTDYIPAKYGRDEMMKAIQNVPHEVVKESFVWGSVGDVTAILEEYRKAGAQTVVLSNFTPMGDVTKIRSSYSCTDQVVSHFKEE